MDQKQKIKQFQPNRITLEPNPKKLKKKAKAQAITVKKKPPPSPNNQTTLHSNHTQNYVNCKTQHADSTCNQAQVKK